MFCKCFSVCNVLKFKNITPRHYCSRNSKTFFVTTPIYYVNAAPHIGHLYSSIVADAAHRWIRLLAPNSEIKFSTGTDEHGTKIQRAAQKNSVSVSAYCDEISAKYKQMADHFNVAYSHFIRTTDQQHENAVKYFWKTIDKNGHIYLKKYSGWYCVPDETFLTNSQLEKIVLPNGESSFVSAESGHPVEWTEEENYMFKLGNFQEDLYQWLTKNDNIVKPKIFQKILLDMITKESLPDISISRPTSRVHWGIRVPGNNSHTIYVWLDALVNYLTVAGYPSVDCLINNWPPDLQVIGKDILKFHGIYWPAFLLAAELKPPKAILCHSHWTVDDEKMSKSRNNVVCPLTASNKYTAEGLRYFLLREGVAHCDGNFSDEKVMRVLNSELADTMGNLLNRCSGVALNPNHVFPRIEPEAFKAISSYDVTKKLIENVSLLPDQCAAHYSEHNFYKAVDRIIATLHSANLFFETLKPWEMRKSVAKEKELDAVIHLTLEVLRVCCVLLQPIIPDFMEKFLNKINVPENRRDFASTKMLSWTMDDFHPFRLSPEKFVLFKRILTEAESLRIKK